MIIAGRRAVRLRCIGDLLIAPIAAGGVSRIASPGTGKKEAECLCSGDVPRRSQPDAQDLEAYREFHPFRNYPGLPYLIQLIEIIVTDLFLMNTSKSLYGALNVTPNDRTRVAIIQNFWPSTNLPIYRLKLLDWEPYFRYYDRQCREALVDRGLFVMAKNHDVLDLTRCFNNAMAREAIREELRPKLATPGRPNEDEILDGAIDLAARLFLMVNIAVDTRTISEQIRLEWTTGSLKECVHTHFKEPQILSDAGLRLEPTFTAVNLESIAGFRVVSTLADHLRLLDRDGTVAVFCDISFLLRHVR
jgi:hypothetical protein